MLGIDRQVARAAWTVFLLGLVIFLVWMARETLVVFALALFFAYMLSPLVELVQRFAPRRMSRNLSLAIVYVLFVGALVGVGFGIGSVVADEASTLADRLPKLIENQDPFANLPLPSFLIQYRDRIVAAIRGQFGNMDKDAFPIIRKAIQSLLAHASSVLMIVLIPILSFFFLKDGPRIRDSVIAWTTKGSASIVLEEILDDVHRLLLKYIRALVVLALATFISYSLFLQFTGGQYALLLGGIAGLLEIIPVVGPLTAAVIIALVEGFSGYPHVLWLLIFMGMYRMFQDYVLSPYLMGSGVELHPLLVLFGVLAGERIAGVPGMFFSVPVIAILRVVYVHLERRRGQLRG